jgi:hypothetical protein
VGPQLLAILEDVGSEIPVGVRLAASAWWVGGWVAVAVLGISTAGVLGHHRSASARVLVAATLSLIVAALFTVLTVMAAFPTHTCCLCGPIR